MSTLVEIRKRLRKSQAEMAQSLGLSLRGYQDAEKDDAPRRAYLMAAEYVALHEAWINADPMLASDKTRKMAAGVTRALVG
jgi:transcriptional regulator with XRE-family HTH domain